MKKISINSIGVAAVVISLLITLFYTRSITILYGGLELLLAALCYLLILKNWRNADPYLLLLFLFITGFSFINGVMRMEIKSVVLLSISLILPLAISVLPLNITEEQKCFKWAFLLGLSLCITQQYFQAFDKINSNTLGFLFYMFTSLGFIWYLCSKKRLVPIILILIGAAVALNTGSRNVAIVIALSVILLFLPKKLYTNAAFFRCLYLLILLYTLFAATIMEWGFNNEFISGILYDYTEQYSDKAWEMTKRITFLHEIRTKLSNLDVMSKLFGEGIMLHHGHNMFYQSLYVYGYIGTAMIYAFFIRIFEMARKLICFNNDKIALGCSIALLGCFLLNGADVFLIGVEACAIIPQVLMGIIIFRYRAMMHPVERLKESVETHESA